MIQGVRKMTLSLFIAPREIENMVEKRKEFERKSSKPFICSAPGMIEKELEIKMYFDIKRYLGSFSFSALGLQTLRGPQKC